MGFAVSRDLLWTPGFGQSGFNDGPCLSANTVAINSYKADREVNIERRQNKYLNNLVEQDHRAVKRIV